MKKVLLVDGDHNARELCQGSLEAAGYQVAVAKNADEALAALGENLDAVALSQKNGTGLKLLERIKEQNSDLPVILRSEYGRFKQDFDTWSSDTYVVQSSDLEDLKLTLKKVLAS